MLLLDSINCGLPCTILIVYFGELISPSYFMGVLQD